MRHVLCMPLCISNYNSQKVMNVHKFVMILTPQYLKEVVKVSVELAEDKDRKEKGIFSHMKEHKNRRAAIWDTWEESEPCRLTLIIMKGREAVCSS